MLKHVGPYSGDYPHDMLPNKLKPTEYLIINLDNYGQPGTHWVCVLNHPNLDFVFYYDSYGLPPSDRIVQLLSTANKDIRFNSSVLQLDKSIMCGYYCAYLIEEFDKNPTVENLYDIIYEFDQEQTIKNEKIIKSKF